MFVKLKNNYQAQIITIFFANLIFDVYISKYKKTLDVPSWFGISKF